METEDALAPPDLLAALRQYWYVALAVVLACAALGGLAAGLLTPSATARASLVVEDPRSNDLYGTGTGDSNYVANQVALLSLRGTSELALQRLGPGGQAGLSADRLSEDLEVSSPGDSGLITIEYQSTSPQLAQRVVNAVVEVYQEGRRAAADAQRTTSLAAVEAALVSLDAEIAARAGASVDDLLQSRDQLVQRRVEVSVDTGTGTGVLVADQASLPVASRPLPPAATASLGGVLGLVPATVLAYVLALGQRRFSTRFEPEAVLAERLLSDVPVFSSERLPSDVPALDARHSAAAEAFRFAATLLAVRQADLESHVHAVVSGASQDGKTTVSANLAVTAAIAGRRVLAVDGDLDGRGLSFLLLGGSAGRGLTDVLQGRARVDDVAVPVDVPGNGRLDVLRGGAVVDGLGELLAAPGTRALLQGVGSEYDLVLVDVPPVLQVAYAAALMRAVDAAVVVVPHGSQEGRLTDLAERLEFLQVPTLGYVYNKAPLRSELGQHSRLVTDDRRRPTDALRGLAPRPSAPVTQSGHAGRDQATSATALPGRRGD